MKLSAAEWPYLTVGCIAACLAGSVSPLFAFIVGDVMQVRNSIAFWSKQYRIITDLMHHNVFQLDN